MVCAISYKIGVMTLVFTIGFTICEVHTDGKVMPSPSLVLELNPDGIRMIFPFQHVHVREEHFRGINAHAYKIRSQQIGIIFAEKIMQGLYLARSGAEKHFLSVLEQAMHLLVQSRHVALQVL